MNILTILWKILLLIILAPCAIIVGLILGIVNCFILPVELTSEVISGIVKE